jgi:Flp pilus assembly protein TadG
MRFDGKFIGRLLRDQRGQTLPFTAVIMVSLMGLSGMAVDAGHGYYAYERLKVATNAATLAGAAGMPDTTTATTNVDTYSSATASDKNFLGAIMSNVSTSITFICSTTVSNKLNVGCEASGGGSGGYNALTVKQTATVKTWFGALFGIPQFNIQAASMAAMAGGADTPYNLAVILDTTESMNSTSTESSCSSSQIVCAVQGLQTMLVNLDPCSLDDSSCSGSAHYVDDVALFTFPPPTPGTVSDDYTCPTHNPSIVPYTFPNVTPGASQNLIMPSTYGTYEVIPFSNNYKANDGATTLEIGSDLAKAVGYSGTGCSGLAAPGGDGTYYAQAIYAAQAALVAQQVANPGSTNVLIILSDGDANACATDGNTAAGGCSTRAQIVASNCSAPGASGCNNTTNLPLNGTGTSSTFPNATINGSAVGYQSYTYPSELGQCGQAVQAASAATTAGTLVFTIGFESETSNGCATDQTFTAAVPSVTTLQAWPKLTGASEAWPGGGSYPKQPCTALGAMASNANTFYSDDASGCAATGKNADYTSLAQIFQAIFTTLTSPRLIPVGTT